MAMLVMAYSVRTEIKREGAYMIEKTSSQARIFLITRALFDNHVLGLSNKELSKIVGTSETNICRDMDLFKKYEWAVRDGSTKWRLSPSFGGIAGILMKSYQDARLRLKREEGRYADAMQKGY